MTDWLFPYFPEWFHPYLLYLLLWGAVTIPAVVIGWIGVFPKAGRSWWEAIIPLYNIYVLVVHVARLTVLWFVLVLVPGVNFIAAILVNVEVAKKFGRSEGFGLGLAVFGFVFYPILGYGKARYQD